MDLRCEYAGRVASGVVSCSHLKIRRDVRESQCRICPLDSTIERLDRPEVSIVAHIFDTSFAECRHRGAKIEDKEADLCGLKGMVFEVMACNCGRVESGRCVATRICGKQAEVACSTCDKREP